MTDKTQALLPVTRAIDAKEEWPAFQSWWSRHRPGDAVPSPSSLIFDAWMQSARHRISHSLPGYVGTVSAADAFEMGFSFGMAMRGQTLEDSRAVGRLLTSDTFKAIAPQIEKTTKEQGFDSFQDADSGMCQAKRIIRAALTPSPCPGDGMPAWRTIDSAPTDGQTILAICASAYTPTAFDTWWQDGWTHYSRPDDKWHGGVGKWFPTHWMPREVYLAALTPSALSGEAGEKP